MQANQPPDPGKTPQLGGSFHVGTWLCEPDLNRISGAETSNQVEPKVMQVLVVLAQAQGQVVSRTDILQTVWTDTFVGEQVLSRAVSELRKAFGDNARNPSVIETIATRGYRIIAPVLPHAAETATEGASQAIEPSPSDSRLSRFAGYAGAGALALVVIAGLVWWLRPDAAPTPSPVAPSTATDLALVLPETAPIELSYFQSFAVSPDGEKIIYSGHVDGKRLLYLRTLNRREVVAIPGTEGGYGPFFSPDAEWVGFYALGSMRAISLKDGTVRQVVRDSADAQGASWSPDGTIVFTRRMLEGLSKISEDGGAVERLTEVNFDEGELSHFWPHILPDGEHALFTVWRGTGSSGSSIDVVNINTGERKRVLEGGSFPRYVATGELVFLHGSRLRAIAFDATTHVASGSSRSILSDPVTYAFTGIPHIALSSNGTLVYASRSDFSARWSVSWLDAEQMRQPAVRERRAFATPRLSPDGTRLATTVMGAAMEIWLFDLGRGAGERLTTIGENLWPIWTPDGRNVIFSSDRDGPFNLYVASADEDVPPVRLTSGPNIQFAGSVSPDGKTVYYGEFNPRARFDIWSVALDGKSPPKPILNSTFDEFRPAVSPDGRLLAYASNEAGRWDTQGRWDIYIRPLDNLDRRIMVSTEGGTDPRWSADGSRLFYRQGGQILSARIHFDGELRAEAPRLELKDVDPPNPVAQIPHFDVASDGRFLVVDRGSQGDATQLNVVLDWLQNSTPPIRDN